MNTITAPCFRTSAHDLAPVDDVSFEQVTQTFGCVRHFATRPDRDARHNEQWNSEVVWKARGEKLLEIETERLKGNFKLVEKKL